MPKLDMILQNLGGVKTLEDVRANEFETFWNDILEKSGNLDIGEPKLPRRRRLPARYVDSSEDESANELPNTEKDYYKNVFTKSFDLILACLKERFEQNGLDMYFNMQDLLLLAAKKKSYVQYNLTMVENLLDLADRYCEVFLF